MKGKLISAGLGALLLVLAAGVIHSQDVPPKPAIDPEAIKILRQMSDRMQKVQIAVFRLADTIDDVQGDGRKLQFAHVRELSVVRPGKLKIETNGDVTNRTVWLDGKTLTVLDRTKNVYAQLQDTGTIDQTIDMLQEKYGMSLPAADLLSTDVYKTLTEGCSEIEYIGTGYAGEEKCHHLAFSRENIDWQLWVTMGDEPAPRKMVITYKQLPGAPQYTLQLLKMEHPRKVKDAVFVCQIPKGAEKIEFHPAAKPE